VVKDSPIEDLLRAISDVAKGHLFLQSSTIEPVVRLLLTEGGKETAGASFLNQFSARELDVLRCLVAGMTRNEVAQHLFLSPNTVRTHVQKLLRVTGLHSTLALVALAREHGVTGPQETERPRAAGASAGNRSPQVPHPRHSSS
jgi:two-component system nitrate/nitrite response regulator NarL